ncbi:GCN5-related N-acetyltransferase [Calothrix sp. NIES-4071]|nr:GCN5-related N-acetyltransferase [Calothrix sp. NIES-4071]BAZ56328.1 GCN5-related N-acetyltransferase [Calothrix sp. NIES-4105]
MEKEKQKIEFSVRLARPEDATQIHYVHVDSVRQLCAGDYTKEQIEAWVGHLNPEKLRQYMINGAEDEVLYIAENKNNLIIGFSSFDKNGDINAIYVHPEYIRKRVGKQLLNAVEMEAIAYNYRKLQISASITAIPFYKANNYKFLKYSSHTLRSGVVIPCALMEKTLATDLTDVTDKFL